MEGDPCSVCGGTEVNLVDGFYYCVECGTQDENARETIVETTVLADGTLAYTHAKKIKLKRKDGVEMSTEWRYWHAYNFVMVGLADNMVKLGASARFREIALWIWMKYMDKFMDKDKMGTTAGVVDKNRSVLFEDDDDDDESRNNLPDNGDNENQNERNKDDTVTEKKERKRCAKMNKDIMEDNLKVMLRSLFASIIYLALNFDQSDIQLRHLIMFIQENRLNLREVQHYVPKELNVKTLPSWMNFMAQASYPTGKVLRKKSWALMKVLKLHTPLIPNLKNMVVDFVSELQLPESFNTLVFSIMRALPPKLEATDKYMKLNDKIPDYEAVIMAYIVLALKMTFGLDNHYEFMLSDKVEQINEESEFPKSHRFGNYSQPTNRLLSFREWCRYLQFRLKMLGKNYVPIARLHSMEINDGPLMEQFERFQPFHKNSQRYKVGDEVAMDILDRIQTTDDGPHVIPKTEFKTSLTPLSTYTAVILEHLQDPDTKLLLSEDFTQYDLTYACVKASLIVDIRNQKNTNVITGVSKDHKFFTTNPSFYNRVPLNLSLVYVRNCDNKNWVTTKPPALKHVIKDEYDNHKHADDSTLEKTAAKDMNENETEKDQLESTDSKIGHASENSNEKDETGEETSDEEHDGTEKERVLETIDEEEEGVSIFDDTFDDIKKENDAAIDIEAEVHDNFEFDVDANLNDAINRSLNMESDDEDVIKKEQFNPTNFQREEIIKKLVLKACKDHKVPVPIEYRTNTPIKRKRKSDLTETNASEGEIKRKKRVVNNKPSETKETIDNIVSLYHKNLENDILHQISKQVHSMNVSKLGENDRKTLSLCESLNQSGLEPFDNIGNDNKESVSKSDDDSSVIVIEDDDESVTDLLPKINPKFDEKTHDTKQLYLKYKDFQFDENMFSIDDPEIDKILAKKIEDSSLDDHSEQMSDKVCVNDDSASEVANDIIDIESRIEKEEIRLQQEEIKRRKKKLPRFLSKRMKGPFRYWMRHFSQNIMKMPSSVELFDTNLRETSQSFSFVIQECGSIINSSAFQIYRNLQYLEVRLLDRIE